MNAFLSFINYIGKESDGKYRYELLFSENPEEFWGDKFEFKPCGLVNKLTPHEEHISDVYIIKTNFELNLIQESMCFGFQDCTDGCVALAYAYDEKDNLIIKFDFGEPYDEVIKKLAEKNIILE